MALTRFFDRQSGRNGPVIGATQMFYIHVASITGGADPVYTVTPPPGAEFYVTHGNWTASATGATPSMVITGAATIVAATTLTTDLGALTVVAGVCNNASPLTITFTTTASDTVTFGELTISGYLSAPPTTYLR